MKPERFLRACRGQAVDCTPVWLMRQAGRYMPEYRAIRQHHSFLQMCTDADLATQVTLLPVEHFDVDAAILFSDLLVPFVPLGLDLVYETHQGPMIENPLREPTDLKRLQPVNAEKDLDYVLQAIVQTRQALKGRVPLLGFVGAPFTLASYAVEGGASRSFARMKTLMWRQPDFFQALLDHFAGVAGQFASAQVRAGVQAVQVFDTWAGVLAPSDFASQVLPHLRRVIASIHAAGPVPVILYVNECAGLLPHLAQSGADVLSLDWRTDLSVARRQLNDAVALQGNLDPCTLFATSEVLEAQIERVLQQAEGLPGYIFNLGHGVLPETNPDQVRRLIEHVHARSQRN